MPPIPLFYGRFCIWCETYFESKWERQRCCSKRCRTYWESRARKLRLKGIGPVISTASIYTRDGGRCQLCGTPVGKQFTYPDPRAATIDHIVPITKGGQHVRENVQLAHAGCNLKKGNRLCGSQLRLVG